MDLFFSPITDDLVVEYGDLVLATSEQAIAQAIRIALRTWLREWFLDTREGTDYPGRVWGRSDPVLRDAEIKRVLLSVPGVVDLLSYSTTVSADRRLSVTGRVRTSTGVESFAVDVEDLIADAAVIPLPAGVRSAGPHALNVQGLQGSVTAVRGADVQSTGPHALNVTGLQGDVTATAPDAVIHSAGPHLLQVQGLQGGVTATNPDAIVYSAGPHALDVQGLQGDVTAAVNAVIGSAGPHDLAIEGLQGDVTSIRNASLSSAGPHDLAVTGLQGDVTAVAVTTFQAYPVVLDQLAQQFASDTPYSVTMPSYVESGDLLLMLVTHDDSQDPTATGWTQEAQQLGSSGASITLLRKTAVGTEGGGTVSVDMGSFFDGPCTVQTFRISKNTWEDVEATGATGSTSSADPPSLNPGAWGDERMLVFASAVSEESFTSQEPYGYGNTEYTDHSSYNWNQATSRLRVSAASEDPGVMSLGSSGVWSALTVAVQGKIVDVDNWYSLLLYHDAEAGVDISTLQLLLEESGGSLVDVSGYGNDPTVGAGVTLGESPIGWGAAASQTGDGGSTGGITSDGLIDIDSDFTLALLGSGPAANADGLCSVGTSAKPYFVFGNLGGDRWARFYSDTSTAKSSSAGGAVPSGAFGVVIQKTDDTVKIFIDGVLWDTLTVTGDNPSTSTLLSFLDGRGAAGLQEWAGGFQHRGVWNVALPDSACAAYSDPDFNGANWTPEGLSLTFWYDAGDPDTLFQDSGLTTPVTTDGQYVRGVADKSGNGLDATNATGTAVYKEASDVNGLPAIRGGASGDILAIPSWTLTTPYTMWAVYQQDSTSGYHYLGTHYVGGGTKVLLEVQGVSGPGLYDGTHKSFGAASQTGSGAYAVVYEASGTARLYKDNVELGSVAYSTYSQTAAGSVLGGASYLVGDLCELILMPGEASPALLAMMNAYLAAKWGL